MISYYPFREVEEVQEEEVEEEEEKRLKMTARTDSTRRWTHTGRREALRTRVSKLNSYIFSHLKESR